MESLLMSSMEIWWHLAYCHALLKLKRNTFFTWSIPGTKRHKINMPSTSAQPRRCSKPDNVKIVKRYKSSTSQETLTTLILIWYGQRSLQFWISFTRNWKWFKDIPSSQIIHEGIAAVLGRQHTITRAGAWPGGTFLWAIFASFCLVQLRNL